MTHNEKMIKKCENDVDKNSLSTLYILAHILPEKLVSKQWGELALAERFAICYDERSTEAVYNHQIREIADYILLDSVPSIPKVHRIHLFDQAMFIPINKGEVIAGSAMTAVLAEFYQFFINHLVSPTFPISDVDVYFHSKEDAIEFAFANKLRIPSALHVIPTKALYEKEMLDNPNCARLSLSLLSYGYISINLIYGVPYNSAEDLISRFDIRACAAAYDLATNEAVFVHGAYGDAAQKSIVFQTYPRSVSVSRIVKYIVKGFRIDKHQRAVFAELIKAGFHDTNLELNTGIY